MQYTIMTTPGLVADDELFCSGKVANKADVTQLNTTALNEETTSQAIDMPHSLRRCMLLASFTRTVLWFTVDHDADGAVQR